MSLFRSHDFPARFSFLHHLLAAAYLLPHSAAVLQQGLPVADEGSAGCGLTRSASDGTLDVHASPEPGWEASTGETVAVTLCFTAWHHLAQTNHAWANINF